MGLEEIFWKFNNKTIKKRRKEILQKLKEDIILMLNIMKQKELKCFNKICIHPGFYPYLFTDGLLKGLIKDNILTINKQKIEIQLTTLMGYEGYCFVLGK